MLKLQELYFALNGELIVQAIPLNTSGLIVPSAASSAFISISIDVKPDGLLFTYDRSGNKKMLEFT